MIALNVVATVLLSIILASLIMGFGDVISKKVDIDVYLLGIAAMVISLFAIWL